MRLLTSFLTVWASAGNAASWPSAVAQVRQWPTREEKQLSNMLLRRLARPRTSGLFWGLNVRGGTLTRNVSRLVEETADANTPEVRRYDLIVVGGGSGGLACAQEAARLGAKVACLDYVLPSSHGTKWGLGGTCVNVGCIPKKLMHQAALVGGLLADAPNFGWKVGRHEPGAAEKRAHDWEELVMSVNMYIRSLNFKYRAALGKAGVDYLNMHGELESRGRVTARDPETGEVSVLESPNILVAVGGRPRPLGCPGGEFAISSDDIFTLQKPPGKTLVVGAGYVALECAGFLQSLGHPCTVMVRSVPLRGFDRDCAERIRRYMEFEGVRFLGPTVPERIEQGLASAAPDSATEEGSDSGASSGGATQAQQQQQQKRLRVHWINEAGELENDVFDTVLAATGRDPQTRGLGLEAAGVATSATGKIQCQQSQTSAAGVFAVGDVVSGAPELTPVAIRAGQVLARRLFGGSEESFEYEGVPTAVFTPLEYGTCGLSEEQATAKLGEDRVEVYHATFTPLEWQLNQDRPRNACYVKVVCDLQNDSRIVGLHILGPGAGEVMQGFALAMQLGATYKDLTKVVGIHPTTAEELVYVSVTKRSGESIERGGC